MFNNMVRWPYMASLVVALSAVMFGERRAEGHTGSVSSDEVRLSAAVTAQSEQGCKERAMKEAKRQFDANSLGGFNSLFISCASGETPNTKSTLMKCDHSMFDGTECNPVVITDPK